MMVEDCRSLPEQAQRTSNLWVDQVWNAENLGNAEVATSGLGELIIA